jgi:Flp pilus assembly protein TadG
MRRFWARIDDDDGSVTVENCLWLPIFFMIIGLAVDASLSIYTATRMLDVARDGARRAATGQMSPEATRHYIEGNLPQRGTYDITVQENSDDIVVHIDATGLSIRVFFDVFDLDKTSTTFRMRKET